MKSCLSYLIAIICIFTFSCSNNVDESSSQGDEKSKTGISPPRTITGFSSSEGVTSDGKYFYVSNIGVELKPTAKDGDGFISRLDSSGGFVDLEFIGNGKLNGPKGMLIIDNTLYIADVDRLLGFDLENGNEVFEMSFNNTLFLNAITSTDKNTLYVTATDANMVFKIDIANRESHSIDLNPFLHQPNGICYDPQNDLLYVVGKSIDEDKAVIAALNLNEENRFTQIAKMDGKFDGIKMHDGSLIISDWGNNNVGRIFSFDPATGMSEALAISEKMQGPAEFYIDQKKGEIWIPRLLESTVLVVGLDS